MEKKGKGQMKYKGSTELKRLLSTWYNETNGSNRAPRGTTILDFLTSFDEDGNGESDMLEALQDLVNDVDFQNLLPGDQLDEMNGIVRQYKETGRELFLLENPDFNARVEDLKQKIKERGKR